MGGWDEVAVVACSEAGHQSRRKPDAKPDADL